MHVFSLLISSPFRYMFSTRVFARNPESRIAQLASSMSEPIQQGKKGGRDRPTLLAPIHTVCVEMLAGSAAAAAAVDETRDTDQHQKKISSARSGDPE